MWNIIGFETMECNCTVLSHVETYNGLEINVSRGICSRSRNKIYDCNIFCEVFVPTGHVGLPAISVRQEILLALIYNVQSQAVHDSSTRCIKRYLSPRKSPVSNSHSVFTSYSTPSNIFAWTATMWYFLFE